MLSEELKKYIGRSDEVTVYEVEKGAIRKFADAVGETNPLYWDEEYARNSRYGSIIAPPGFFGWPTSPGGGSFVFFGKTKEDEPPPLEKEIEDSLAEAGYSRVLDGGIEYEFLLPVRAGDTLSASTTIKDITERKGRSGQLAFVIRETTYLNQDGALVARVRQTLIHR